MSARLSAYGNVDGGETRAAGKERHRHGDTLNPESHSGAGPWIPATPDTHNHAQHKAWFILRKGLYAYTGLRRSETLSVLSGRVQHFLTAGHSVKGKQRRQGL